MFKHFFFSIRKKSPVIGSYRLSDGTVLEVGRQHFFDGPMVSSNNHEYVENIGTVAVTAYGKRHCCPIFLEKRRFGFLFEEKPIYFQQLTYKNRPCGA